MALPCARIEVDPYGFVRASAYINYLEESRFGPARSLGYGYDWYFEQQRMWLVPQG
jgi:acyl-CoA thioesterase FadM